MRLNVREDPKPTKRHRAYLDGADVSDGCFEADDEAGYVLLYKFGPDGKHMLTADGMDVQWERLTGKVRIEVVAELASPKE